MRSLWSSELALDYNRQQLKAVSQTQKDKAEKPRHLALEEQ